MNIYGISGLGADHRVFQNLQLTPYKIKEIAWIEPHNDEPLKKYAARMSEQINPDEDIIIIAVSFGGLVAVELNKILNVRLAVLISSAERDEELRTLYKLAGRMGILKWVPSGLLNAPKFLMYLAFGAKNKKMLDEILKDTDPEFTKWAIYQLCKWKNAAHSKNVVKIHGTKDKLIPYLPSEHTIAIKDGEHFMVVDRADEISGLLKELFSKRI